MRFLTGSLLLLLSASLATAQDLPSKSLTRGTWEAGVFAGGGTGLAKSSNTQFLLAGGRVGRVLTREHLRGWARGNFEFAADFMPVYVVLTPNQNIYGGSFKPVILQWNFTRGRKLAPYIAAAAGVLFSTANVPPGNTSYVNFTPQGAFGVHLFTRPKRSLNFEGAVVHHSSASLGMQNPGYNASLFFTLGYSWFK